MNSALQRAFYRYGWDTRCRNLTPARLLRPFLGRPRKSNGAALLDVGCGHLGLAAFFPDIPVVGIDPVIPAATPANVEFQSGSVMALPFADASFSVVSCIDVLEHLSKSDRVRAISELVRVTSDALLIACPHGQTARKCDEEFRRASESRGRPLPDWVAEHLQHPYPNSEEIVAQLQSAAAATGRSAAVSVSYCEPTGVSRLIRAAAARSDLLYAAVNLCFGVLLPLLPQPPADGSYRAVLLARLSMDKGHSA